MTKPMTDLQRRYLARAISTEVAAILESAFEEDAREGRRFDAAGFAQFCPEDNENDITTAWLDYCAYHHERSQTKGRP